MILCFPADYLQLPSQILPNIYLYPSALVCTVHISNISIVVVSNMDKSDELNISGTSAV